MEKLEKEIKKNGFVYEQLARCEHAAIYRAKNSGQYEVFLIKIQKAGEVFGKQLNDRESYPSTEDFGSIAWCIADKLRAWAKYYSLRDNEELKEKYLKRVENLK